MVTRTVGAGLDSLPFARSNGGRKNAVYSFSVDGHISAGVGSGAGTMVDSLAAGTVWPVGGAGCCEAVINECGTMVGLS
jgi:hypothetical protein